MCSPKLVWFFLAVPHGIGLNFPTCTEHIYLEHTFRLVAAIVGLHPVKSVSVKVGLYSGCDSDATDLRCRYPIAMHLIADHRYRKFS